VKILALLLVALSALGALVADAQAKSYPLGVYVTSMHDLDVSRKTVSADLWLWSVSPDAVRPLDSVEFVNADSVSRSLASTGSGHKEPGRRSRSAARSGSSGTSPTFPSTVRL
jgi:hypothetical protein